MPRADRRAAFRPAPCKRFLLAGRSSRWAAGYTMLELMVVIMLLGILLGFAVPAFQRGGSADSLEGAVRRLHHAVGKLKAAALSRQQTYKLHLDMDENRIWVTRDVPGDGKANKDDTTARQAEWALTDDVHIASVNFPDNRDIRSGSVAIAFYPQGYSDRAIVRLSDDGNTSTDLIIEAFLPMALVAADNEETTF